MDPYHLDPASIMLTDDADPDSLVAVTAMRNAQATSLAHGNSDRYWLVDAAAVDPVDMVCVVDLTAIGNVAKGMGADWAGRAKSMRLYRVDDGHATRDVLNALTERVSRLRGERPEPEPI